jgi:hypothetical protein
MRGDCISRIQTPHVIPAEAGIQKHKCVTKSLDTGFHRCDKFCNYLMTLTICITVVIAFIVSPLWAEEAKKAIEVFPSTPYYQFIIFENLAIFWIAIIGLIVILRMKLREIEHRQKLGLDREENEAPRLD